MKYKTLVEETTTTTDTNDLFLSGATTGHRAFSAAYSADDWVNYLIKDANGTAWERGIGKFNGTTGLTRFLVRESTNAGAKIVLTAGTHTVSVTANPDMGEFRGYRLCRNGSSQSIPNSTTTDVVFDSKTEDTDDAISVPTTTFLPVPDYVDRIQVTGMISWSSAASGRVWVQGIGITGSTYTFSGLPQSILPLVGEIVRQPFVSGIIPPEQNGANRGIAIRVSQTSGAALNLLIGSWVCVEFIQ